MLSIFKFSKKLQGDFSDLLTDMHSHVLPGLDDGAKNLDESLSLIRGLADLGFRQLFASPHSMEEIYPNTPELIRPVYEKVREQLPEGISLDWTSEYFLDEFFMRNLNSDDLRPLPGNRLLIEFSMITYPRHLTEVLFEVQTRSYQIVLAHPERYVFAHRDPGFLESLRDMGIEFQLNALSLGGYYGHRVKKLAEELVDKGWIDFLGTDVHHEKHLGALREVPGLPYYRKLLHSGNLKNSSLAG